MKTYLEVKEFLHEDSQRLGKPSLCPQFLYEMMLHCWVKSYQFRPSFLQLKNQLEHFETEERISESVEVSEEHDYGYLPMTYLSLPMYEAHSSTFFKTMHFDNMTYGLE